MQANAIEVSPTASTTPVSQVFTGKEIIQQIFQSNNKIPAIRLTGDYNDPESYNEWFTDQFDTYITPSGRTYYPKDGYVTSTLQSITEHWNTHYPDKGLIIPVKLFQANNSLTYKDSEDIVKTHYPQLLDDLENINESFNGSILRIHPDEMDDACFPDFNHFIPYVSYSQSTSYVSTYTLTDLIKLVKVMVEVVPDSIGDSDVIRAILGINHASHNAFNTVLPAAVIQDMINNWIALIPNALNSNNTYDVTALQQAVGMSDWIGQIVNRFHTIIKNSGTKMYNGLNGNPLTGTTELVKPNISATMDYTGKTVHGTFKQLKVHRSMFGHFYELQINRHSFITGKYLPYVHSLYFRDLSDVVVTTITYDEDIINNNKLLVQTFQSLNNDGPVPLLYTGQAEVPSMFGTTPVFIKGSVILDPVGCKESDMSTYNSLSGDYVTGRDTDDNKLEDRISDIDISNDRDALMMLDGHIIGFSLSSRTWVLLDFNKSSPMVYDKTIIDKLVLPSSEKTNITAIVNNLNTDFVDIVSEKGGGAIFLLYGPPGLGKTLTAEAISAACERPLYKLSIGELGTNVKQLEQNLQQILTFATRWNATLLFDEADIFLESRDTHNIERNAMVGVFLRLLEYFPGILFLTTNRIRNFDEAFFSRITYAIEFTDQTIEDRAKVWTNLLSAAKIECTPEQINSLATNAINNRQVKTCITNAQRFACSESQSVNFDYIVRALQSIVKFDQSLRQNVKA